jgi:hypothetical protein
LLCCSCADCQLGSPYTTDATGAKVPAAHAVVRWFVRNVHKCQTVPVWQSKPNLCAPV